MKQEKNTLINLVQIENIENINTYHLFINWVSAEFDLFLQHEEKNLEVYFPNGSFVIENHSDKNGKLCISIKVIGKSKNSCLSILKKLKKIYNNILKSKKV